MDNMPPAFPRMGGGDPNKDWGGDPVDGKKKSGHAAAQRRYESTHTARMTLQVSKADMDMLDRLAAYTGQSRTAYIMQAVRERAERDDAPAGRV